MLQSPSVILYSPENMLDNMVQDTLSSTLIRMRLKASAAGALDAGGKWAVEFPAHEGFKLQLILKGEASISIDGDGSTCSTKNGRLPTDYRWKTLCHGERPLDRKEGKT